MTIPAIDIAMGALREVGSLSPYDVDADPNDLAIALEKLDSILAEKVGTEDLWFFIPKAVTCTLTADIGTYNLNDITGTTNFQFVRGINSVDSSGGEEEITLIRRDGFEDKRGDITYNGSSRPSYAYVERKDNPQITFLSAPSASWTTVKIWGQTYSDDIINVCNSDKYVGFSDAWKLCLELELAANIGRGSVVTLPDRQLSRLEGLAAIKWDKLMSRNNKENVKRPRYTKPRDF